MMNWLKCLNKKVYLFLALNKNDKIDWKNILALTIKAITKKTELLIKLRELNKKGKKDEQKIRGNESENKIKKLLMRRKGKWEMLNLKKWFKNKFIKFINWQIIYQVKTWNCVFV